VAQAVSPAHAALKVFCHEAAGCVWCEQGESWGAILQRLSVRTGGGVCRASESTRPDAEHNERRNPMRTEPWWRFRGRWEMRRQRPGLTQTPISSTTLLHAAIKSPPKL